MTPQVDTSTVRRFPRSSPQEFANVTAYRIPLFDLNYSDEEMSAVVDVLRSRWISMGPRTEEFERKMCGMIGVDHAVAVSSCTAALHLALCVLGIGPGDEVIVPSLSFVATVNCTRYVGATPVFCDIHGPEDLTVSPQRFAELISPRTRAIVVMHYAGFPCRMSEILDVAAAHRLHVVEDAAHAPLSEYDGRHLGALGDIGCFSFFSNKNISTAEGGMLVTNNREYHERAKLLRSHGMTSLSYARAQGHAVGYNVVEVGYNYRLDDIRAALGIAQLARLREDLRRRARVRSQYVERLRSQKHIIIPFLANARPASNYIFPIVLAPDAPLKRDDVRHALAERGIQTSVHYPAVHRFDAYREQSASLPNTEYVADHQITLPMYGSLGESQVDDITDALRCILV